MENRQTGSQLRHGGALLPPEQLQDGFGDDPKAIQFVFQPPDRSESYIESEDLVDGVGLYPVSHQSSVIDIVSQGHRPTIHIPFFLEAAILSRIRGATSRRANSDRSFCS